MLDNEQIAFIASHLPGPHEYVDVEIVRALLDNRAELVAEIARLRAESNERQNVASAAMFQYDVLVGHAKRLRRMLTSWALWGESHTNTFGSGGELVVATKRALAALDAQEATDE